MIPGRIFAFAVLACAWPDAAPAAEVSPPRDISHFDLMPKPAFLPDGTLAAFFIEHRGPGLSPTPAQQHILARYSKDGGATWSGPETLVTLPSDKGSFGFFTDLVDRDGEVHVFMLGDGGTGLIRPNPGAVRDGSGHAYYKQRLDIWYVRSLDHRTRWTSPRMIWQCRGGDLLSVTQLRNGRILLPICYATDRNWHRRGDGFAAFTYYGQFDVTTLYSDDSGGTWTRGASVLRTPTPGLDSLGAIEPIVLQLDDHRVWMLIRTQLGRFYQSFSPDGSAWSPPEPSPIISSDSPAGLMRLPDGRIVMLWNNCLRYPYAQGGRRVLHAAVSRDEGRTWQGYREILRDPLRDEPPPPDGDHGVSYPFPTVSRQGKVVYSLWVETGPGRSLFQFDPDWLEQTEQREDFSGGLEAWSIFGTRGVEVMPDPEAARGRALRLKPVGSEWPTAAVWNFPMGADGTLTMSLRADAGAAPILLLLTDHFSSPFDEEDIFNSVYTLKLGSGGVAVPPGHWSALELQWSSSDRLCRVRLDGRDRGTLRPDRRSDGVCYLRLRASNRAAAPGPWRVESVGVRVRPPRAADHQARAMP